MLTKGPFFPGLWCHETVTSRYFYPVLSSFRITLDVIFYIAIIFLFIVIIFKCVSLSVLQMQEEKYMYSHICLIFNAIIAKGLLLTLYYLN